MANTNRQYTSGSITLFLATLAGLLFSGYSAVSADETDVRCDYVTQLNDPQALKKHLAMKEEMNLIAWVRRESLQAGTARSTPEELTSFREFDEYSRQCISCHELKGKMAVKEIIDAYYPKKNSQMASIYATHAIGTDYVAASVRNGSLHNVSELPPAMTLISGRIGCLTCHDPLNPKKGHLVVDASGSALCFACHRF